METKITKHTQGQWQIMWGNYTHFATINKDISTRICTIDLSEGCAPIDEAQFNAKLIAAAPELLIVLNDLIQAHEVGMGKKAIALRIAIAKDIIKKATE